MTGTEYDDNLISIHTLTRRVTVSRILDDGNTVISIHTLTRRVTYFTD